MSEHEKLRLLLLLPVKNQTIEMAIAMQMEKYLIASSSSLFESNANKEPTGSPIHAFDSMDIPFLHSYHDRF